LEGAVAPESDRVSTQPVGPIETRRNPSGDGRGSTPPEEAIVRCTGGCGTILRRCVFPALGRPHAILLQPMSAVCLDRYLPPLSVPLMACPPVFNSLYT